MLVGVRRSGSQVSLCDRTNRAGTCSNLKIKYGSLRPRPRDEFHRNLFDASPSRPSRRKWYRSSPGQRGSRLGIEGGGYRRDHLRALTQRAEVADREVRIIGSKSPLLQSLATASGAKPATPGVRASVLKVVERVALGSAHRVPHQVRAGHQPRCRQSARSQCTANAARDRR